MNAINNEQNSRISPPLSEPLYGASFSQSVKRFFKKYARFSGYASRSEYWWATLFTFLLSIIPSILVIAGAVMSPMEETSYGTYEYSGSPLGSFLMVAGFIVFFLLWLAMIVPSLAICWRRLHDAGFSGAFYFLSFIPSIGGLILLVFMVLPTKQEARRAEWNDTTGD